MPGPPNFFSVASGDRADTIYLLRFSAPVCVDADPSDGVNTAEGDIAQMQVVFQERVKPRSLLGRTISLSGELMHADNANHRTKVILFNALPSP